MKKVLKRLFALIPAYAILPVLSFLLVNFLAFTVTEWTMDSVTRYAIALPLDEKIPFLPPFILVYVLAFGQWALSWILIARESPETVCRFAFADIVSKLIALACFLLYPTTMDRPAFEVTDFFTFLVRFIYQVDKPYNLFPSIHVIESYLALRAAFQLKHVSKAYRAFSIVFTVLVCLAILFVKQHLVLDIPGGILACEMGLLAARICHRPLKTLSERLPYGK